MSAATLHPIVFVQAWRTRSARVSSCGTADRTRKVWASRCRIVSISPGSIDTAMGRLEEQSGSGAMLRHAALKRFGRPGGSRGAVGVLAPAMSRLLTGIDILCDGGVVASMTIRDKLAVARNTKSFACCCDHGADDGNRTRVFTGRPTLRTIVDPSHAPSLEDSQRPVWAVARNEGRQLAGRRRPRQSLDSGRRHRNDVYNIFR